MKKSKKDTKATTKRAEPRSKTPAKGTPSKPGKGAKAPPEKKTSKATKAPAPQKASAPPAPPPEPTPAPKTPLAEDIPGAPINGVHLARCIRYAAKVTPKEDGEIVFTHDRDGRALISGHDQRRSHTGFLVVGAAMLCDISVPRADACEFAKMLEGLVGPLGRIDREGNAVFNHGVGQPPARFALGFRPITQHWQPPSQGERPQSVGPLRIPAAAQSAAVKWPSSIMQSWQSGDGIEFITVTDQESGELLARAVIAQEGRDLYPEDERQTEIAGTRTAGARAEERKVERPAEKPAEPAELAPAKPAEKPATVEPETPASGAVTIEADGAAVTIDEDAPAPLAAEAPAFPAPGMRPVVIEVPEKLYNDLLEAVREELRVPAKTQVWWFVGPTTITSSSMNAESAVAAGAILAAQGLRCGKVDATTRHGADVDLWIVERAPAAKAGG